ncbi:hypothetical protein COBT_004044, partial [Conglomerata obtusa]
MTKGNVYYVDKLPDTDDKMLSGVAKIKAYTIYISHLLTETLFTFYQIKNQVFDHCNSRAYYYKYKVFVYYKNLGFAKFLIAFTYYERPGSDLPLL